MLPLATGVGVAGFTPPTWSLDVQPKDETKRQLDEARMEIARLQDMLEKDGNRGFSSNSTVGGGSGGSSNSQASSSTPEKGFSRQRVAKGSRTAASESLSSAGYQSDKSGDSSGASSTRAPFTGDRLRVESPMSSRGAGGQSSGVTTEESAGGPTESGGGSSQEDKNGSSEGSDEGCTRPRSRVVVKEFPTSPSTQKDDAALVMVTKKNTFIHVDVIDEPVTSRRRTKSSPGAWHYLWDDGCADGDNWCYTSIVKSRSTAGTKRPPLPTSVLVSPYQPAWSTPCSPVQPAWTFSPMLKPWGGRYKPSVDAVFEVESPKPLVGGQEKSRRTKSTLEKSEPEPVSTSDSESGGRESLSALEFVFREYVAKERNDGYTIMWHGLPSKCHVEPDLIPVLESLGANDVEYIYLPLNHWEKTRAASSKCRNKGYAFLHFSNEAAAKDFAEKVVEPIEMLNTKKTSTTAAWFQGISANLIQLLQAPHKRTADGMIYLRSGNKMSGVFLGSLRKMLKTNRSP